MSYKWPTNIQASIALGLSGYMANQGYNVNQTSQSNSINIFARSADELEGITDRTLTVEIAPSFNIANPMQLGASGWNYSLGVEINVFTKTDRDVEVLLHKVSRYFRNPVNYYNWESVIVSGLGAGVTAHNIRFERPSYQRLRDEKLTTNRYKNHRGSSLVRVTIDADELLD